MKARVKAAALLLAIVLGGCGGGAGLGAGDSNRGTLSGKLQVSIDSMGRADFREAAANMAGGHGGWSHVLRTTVDQGPNMPCPPLPLRFKDIQNGTSIKVESGNGNTLALGSLTNGLWTFDPSKKADMGCVFDFTMENVAKDQEFYEFTLGDRGGETFSRADLQARGWKVDLLLESG